MRPEGKPMKTAAIVAVVVMLFVIAAASAIQAEEVVVPVTGCDDTITLKYGGKAMKIGVDYGEETYRTYHFPIRISRGTERRNFSVPQRITARDIEVLGGTGSRLVSFLLDVQGVDAVGIYSETLEIAIGRAYRWSDVQSCLLAVLREVLLQGQSYKATGTREEGKIRVVDVHCIDPRTEVYHFNRRLEMTTSLLVLDLSVPTPVLNRQLAVVGERGKQLTRGIVDMDGVCWIWLQPHSVLISLEDEEQWPLIRMLLLETLCDVFGEREISIEVVEAVRTRGDSTTFDIIEDAMGRAGLPTARPPGKK
jgi:hypothetical protein